MRALVSFAAGPIATALLSAACWWLWAGDHGLSHLLRVDDLDLPVRVAAIFALLSVADQIHNRIGWLARH